MCDEGCVARGSLRACEWDECALGGVNPVLINDCVCCAEDTGSSAIHACVCLALSLSLSLICLPRSPPLPTLQVERGTMRACGSSKVRLRYGIKYVLLLLGQDWQAAGRRQPMLTISGLR